MISDKIKQLFSRVLGSDVYVSNPTDQNKKQPTATPTPTPVPTLAPTNAPVIFGVPTMAVVNQTTVLTDAQIQQAVAAIQVQVDRDFLPAWGTTAKLRFVPKGSKPLATDWVITMLDTSDQQGALGYHDMSNTGLPFARIFAKDDLKYGLSWTVTLSHEVLEMLEDPYVANCVFVQDSNTTGILYALETCDPCEADEFGYKINNVLVSDFIYPAWFEGFRTPFSTKFDYMGKISKPFQLIEGGYISQFIVGPNSQGWSQLTANSVPTARNTKGTESRFQRRVHSRKPLIMLPANSGMTGVAHPPVTDKTYLLGDI
jgi:hypothetical protein